MSLTATDPNEVRRATKGRQKKAHPPHNPHGRAARQKRASATKAALAVKMKSTPNAMMIAMAILDGFAKSACTDGDQKKLLNTVIEAVKKQRNGKVKSDSIRLGIAAVLAELPLH